VTTSSLSARRKRRALPGLIGTLAVIVLAAGCASSGGKAKASSDNAQTLGSPVKGGTLSIGMQQEPTCINAEVGAQFAAQTITRASVDSLVEQSSDGGSFKPWLATSWTITPDSKHFTFVLRKGVKFSTGRPFNAAAVKANFDNEANPTSKNTGAEQFLTGYQSTTVINDYTVEVNFKKGDQPFLQAVSTPYLGIQDPTTLSADGACHGAVGTGPYIFVSYTPQNSVVLKRNPNYTSPPPSARHTGAPYLSGLKFLFIPQDATRVGALQSGQVEAIDGTPVTNVDQLSSDYDVLKVPQPGGTWIMHINTTSPQWSTVAARNALRESLDINGTLQAVFGGKIQRAWGPLSPETPSYNKAVENSWKYDPTAAGKAFDALGYTQRDSQGYRTKDGKRLTVVIYGSPNEDREQRPDIIQLFKDQLKKVGVDLDYTDLSEAESEAKSAAGAYDITTYAYVRADADQLNQLFESINYSKQTNPQVTADITAAEGSTSQAVQDKDYGAVQKIVIDQAYIIPVYVETQIYSYSSKVHGIDLDATGWQTFYDAWVS
jgi:peptide/nickel transport system substrate-binding protein